MVAGAISITSVGQARTQRVHLTWVLQEGHREAEKTREMLEPPSGTLVSKLWVSLKRTQTYQWKELWRITRRLYIVSNHVCKSSFLCLPPPNNLLATDSKQLDSRPIQTGRNLRADFARVGVTSLFSLNCPPPPPSAGKTHFKTLLTTLPSASLQTAPLPCRVQASRETLLSRSPFQTKLCRKRQVCLLGDKPNLGRGLIMGI